MITQNCVVDGSTYSIPANCCCTVTCTLATDQFGGEELLFLSVFAKGYVSDIKIDGLPLSFPYLINPTATLEFTYCAPATPSSEQLQIDIIGTGGTTVTISTFDGLTDGLFSPSSPDFGDVVVGNSTQQFISINPTQNLLCCNTFNMNQLTGNFIVNPDSLTLCGNDSQGFYVTFSPSTTGLFSSAVRINVNSCLQILLPITGRGIEAPSGGGTRNEQKNKVDQTTRVEACSPRTANNRCQTARTMQSAIRTNARRFGKR